MLHYFLTLGIYSAILLLILLFRSIKELPEKLSIIANIIMWYSILNFANIFPWFGFGNMNWTGKLLVLFIVIVLAIYGKLKNKEGFILFVFNAKNKTMILTSGIIYLVIVFSVLLLLLAHGKFNIERFLMNVILVGVSEELYFRGFLYKKLLFLNKNSESKYEKYIAMIICSIAFAILHMYFFRLSFAQNIINFVIPLLLCFDHILYVKARNILVPILIHNSIDTAYYGIYAILEIYFFKLGGA